MDSNRRTIREVRKNCKGDEMKPSLHKLMFEEIAEDPSIDRPDNEESVDRQILRAIMDAERSAIKSGKSQESMTVIEAVNRHSLGFIFEEEGADSTSVPPLDVGTFAMEIMRTVKNFDTLLDIPTVILNRAKAYIAQKYDKKTSDSFMELLKNEYDLTIGKEGIAPERSFEAGDNIAVGAMGTAGA